jgi:hypothetical protein
MRAAIGSLLLCASALGAAAEDGEALADRSEARTRAAEVLDSVRYQKEIPEIEGSFTIPMPDYFARFLTIGLWAVVVLAIIAVVVVVAQAITRTGVFRPVEKIAPGAVKVARSRAQVPTIQDADGLAERGEYHDAVHLLLLVAIGEAARATDARFPPSTTSRELTRILPLRDLPKARFGELVASVERSLFGGDVVAATDYALCRERCLAVVGRDR